MKIKIKEQVTVEKEIEVSFPLYLAHSDILDNGATWESEIAIVAEPRDRKRVNVYSITKRTGTGYEVEFEMKIDQINIEHGLAQFMSLEASNEIDYNLLRMQAIEHLTQFVVS